MTSWTGKTKWSSLGVIIWPTKFQALSTRENCPIGFCSQSNIFYPLHRCKNIIIIIGFYYVQKRIFFLHFFQCLTSDILNWQNKMVIPRCDHLTHEAPGLVSERVLPIWSCSQSNIFYLCIDAKILLLLFFYYFQMDN
jgi:hypothetical protein